jgi:hypothetical protein
MLCGHQIGPNTCELDVLSLTFSGVSRTMFSNDTDSMFAGLGGLQFEDDIEAVLDR